MASVNSLDAVKRKIQYLQQQADDAEDRAQVLQRQLDSEREIREKVRQSNSLYYHGLFPLSFNGYPMLSYRQTTGALFNLFRIRFSRFRKCNAFISLIHWRA